MSYNDLKSVFSSYVKGFMTGSPVDIHAVKLKIIHSQRVANQIFHLGKRLGLNGADLETALIAGLFHDIGRFRQYQDYRTFNDSKSEDHALLGLKEIDRLRLFDGLATETSELIKSAIENHNKKTVKATGDRKTDFFVLLLRDSDKLDIWRVMIAHVKKGNTGRHDPVTQNMPHSSFLSEGMTDYLESGKIIPLSDVKNLNDYKMFLISWIFDMNFRPSLEAASRRKIIRMIHNTLPGSCQSPYLVEKLEKMLSEKISGSWGSYGDFC